MPSSAPPAHSKVLICCYQFPPLGGVGVQRALSFVRFLPAQGCEVFVVTPGNAATAYRDPGLLDLIPSSVNVHRTFTPELPFWIRDGLWSKIRGAGGGGGHGSPNATSPPQQAAKPSEPETPSPAAKPSGGLRQFARKAIERFVCPDPQVGWVPFAVREASRVIRAHNIDTVLITVPPFSTLQVGIELKRRFPHIKLISDFRDEWLGYYLSSADRSANDYKKQVAVRMEREAVELSEFVVSVTPSWVRQIRSRYPQQPDSKFLYIPNGYDLDALGGFTPRPHKTDKIVISYMGTVYANPVYSPKPFLQALERLPEAIRDQFEVRFIGRVVDEAIPDLDGSRCNIKRLGFMPQRDAIRQLEETDYLLLIVNYPSAHAGKLFEYMATGKPILALTPPGGEIDRVLRETQSGWCIDSEDSASIERALLAVYEQRQTGSGSAITPDKAAIAEYERSRLVAKLASLIGIGQHSSLENSVR